jgi:hypothetical protein
LKFISAVVCIFFKAPLLEHAYESQWQAYNSPDGVAFGDPVFIKIVVIT